MKLFILLPILLFSNISFAHNNRDFMTRITNIECKTDGHEILMKWDSAISPLGPIEFSHNGKDLNEMVIMTFKKDSTIFESKEKKVKLTLHNDNHKKRRFEETAEVDGKKVKLTCSNESKLKFFRKRPHSHDSTEKTPAAQ